MTTAFAGAVLDADGRPFDRIRLTGLSATGHHGVFEHEKAEGQLFRADVVLHLDTRAAASGDDLAQTVSYAGVAEDVVAVLEGSPADLVETVAERIAATILTHPEVVAVDVAVHKPQAPITVPFEDVEVVIRRDRVVVPVVAPLRRQSLQGGRPDGGDPRQSAPVGPIPVGSVAPALIHGVENVAPAAEERVALAPAPDVMPPSISPVTGAVVEVDTARADPVPTELPVPPAPTAEAATGAEAVADGHVDPEPVVPEPVLPAAELDAPREEPAVVTPAVPAPEFASVAPEPVAPEPVVPEPVRPEPALPEPALPEQVVPAPPAAVGPELLAAGLTAAEAPGAGAGETADPASAPVADPGPVHSGDAHAVGVPAEDEAAPQAEPAAAQPTDVDEVAAVAAGGGGALDEPAAPAEAAAEHERDRMDEVPAGFVEVVLALGANLGDAQQTLRDAITDLDRISGLEITEVSPLARTAAVGGPEQPDFLNTVLLARTRLSARDLLLACQSVEQAHGRVRDQHWGPRTLDVDLIVYGTLTAVADDLELPHPRAHERAFVLEPWAQIDPDAVLPGLGGGPVAALAATAPDRGGIRWLALDWLTDPAPEPTGAVPVATGSTDAAPAPHPAPQAQAQAAPAPPAAPPPAPAPAATPEPPAAQPVQPQAAPSYTPTPAAPQPFAPQDPDRQPPAQPPAPSAALPTAVPTVPPLAPLVAPPVAAPAVQPQELVRERRPVFAPVSEGVAPEAPRDDAPPAPLPDDGMIRSVPFAPVSEGVAPVPASAPGPLADSSLHAAGDPWPPFPPVSGPAPDAQR